MPAADSGSDQGNQGALEATLVQKGVVQLTPEEMRLLAEKLYAMLRADVRTMQDRRQEAQVRR